MSTMWWKQDKINMERVKREVKDICCKHCNKIYVTMPKWRRYNEETKNKAIKLYMDGRQYWRAVGRILRISINTCIYWIKKYAKTIKGKNSQTKE